MRNRRPCTLPVSIAALALTVAQAQAAPGRKPHGGSGNIQENTQIGLIEKKLRTRYPGITRWRVDLHPGRGPRRLDEYRHEARSWAAAGTTAGQQIVDTGVVHVAKWRGSPTGIDRVELSRPSISEEHTRRVIRDALGIRGPGYRYELGPRGTGELREVRVTRLADGRCKQGHVIIARDSRNRGKRRALFSSGPFGPP